MMLKSLLLQPSMGEVKILQTFYHRFLNCLADPTVATIRAIYETDTFVVSKFFIVAPVRLIISL